jgi:hypothetical protein
MRVRINTDDDVMAAHVDQLLRFYLIGLDGEVAAVTITVSISACEPLQEPRYRCQVNAALMRGRALEVEEAQADLALAVTRALARSVRTLRRQLGHDLRMRSS